MIVDLNELDFRQAKALIKWCVANNIDKEHADELLFAWYAAPLPMQQGKLYGDDLRWELDIPSEHLTYFMLKWK